MIKYLINKYKREFFNNFNGFYSVKSYEKDKNFPISFFLSPNPTSTPSSLSSRLSMSLSASTSAALSHASSTSSRTCSISTSPSFLQMSATSLSSCHAYYQFYFYYKNLEINFLNNLLKKKF